MQNTIDIRVISHYQLEKFINCLLKLLLSTSLALNYRLGSDFVFKFIQLFIKLKCVCYVGGYVLLYFDAYCKLMIEISGKLNKLNKRIG